MPNWLGDGLFTLSPAQRHKILYGGTLETGRIPDMEYGPYLCRIHRVVDADTVYVIVDLGFRVHTTISIRLLGIDAPELFSGPPEERERGKAAKEYVKTLIPVGTLCTLRPYKDRRSFNRYVGSLLLPDGADLASTIQAAGHAQWADY